MFKVSFKKYWDVPLGQCINEKALSHILGNVNGL